MTVLFHVSELEHWRVSNCFKITKRQFPSSLIHTHMIIRHTNTKRTKTAIMNVSILLWWHVWLLRWNWFVFIFYSTRSFYFVIDIGCRVGPALGGGAVGFRAQIEPWIGSVGAHLFWFSFFCIISAYWYMAKECSLRLKCCRKVMPGALAGGAMTSGSHLSGARDLQEPLDVGLRISAETRWTSAFLLKLSNITVKSVFFWVKFACNNSNVR